MHQPLSLARHQPDQAVRSTFDGVVPALSTGWDSRWISMNVTASHFRLICLAALLYLALYLADFPLHTH